jgi:hypothetical protein
MLSPAGGVPGDLANTFVGTARALSLAVAPGTQPVVAWPGTQTPTNVAQLVSGTTWTTLGRAPNSDILSYSIDGPVVRVNSSGGIFLAWIDPQVETSGNVEDLVSVSRFDGTTWQPLGGPLVTSDLARDYDMTIDSSGAPIVADTEVSMHGGGLVYTYRWNGTAWQAPAPGVAAAGPALQTYVYASTIAIDGSGRLVSSWVHFDNTTPVATAIAVARYQP